MEIYSYHIHSTRAGSAWFHEDTQDWVKNLESSTRFQSYDLAKRIAARLARESEPGISHSVLAVVGN